MPETKNILEAVDEVDQATIFYGNSDPVITAMRETSYMSTSAYIEISAPVVTTELLDAIKQMDELIPTYVLFNDFDSAEEGMQQSIIELMTKHSHGRSVMTAFVHGDPPNIGDLPPALQVYHVKDFDTCTLVTTEQVA